MKKSKCSTLKEWVLSQSCSWIGNNPKSLFALFIGIFVFAGVMYIFPDGNNPTGRAFVIAIFVAIFSLLGWIFRQYLSERYDRKKSNKEIIALCESIMSELEILKNIFSENNNTKSNSFNFVFVFTANQDYISIYNAYVDKLFRLNEESRKSVIETYIFIKSYIDMSIEVGKIRDKINEAAYECDVINNQEHQNNVIRFAQIRHNELSKTNDYYSKKISEVNVNLNKLVSKTIDCLNQQKSEALNALAEEPSLF